MWAHGLSPRDTLGSDKQSLILDYGWVVTVGDIAVVLVHGIFSSPKTWSDIEARIAEDPILSAKCDVFYLPYASPRIRYSLRRSIPEYDVIADDLQTLLKVEIAEHPKIVLVSHSQGGLIVQRYLARMIKAGRGRKLSRIKSFVMFACPNEGSRLLLGPRRFATIWKHSQEEQLRPLAKEVATARNTVLEHIVNTEFVDDYHCRIPIHAYAGTEDKIVEPTSAMSVFKTATALPGDHNSIIKAPFANSRAFTTLRMHIMEVINLQEEEEDAPHVRSGRLHDDMLPAIQAVKNNLTPPSSTFFNRKQEFLRVVEGLQSGYTVISISGLGGMGKSALANRVAWSYVDRENSAPYFNYIVWVGGPGGLPTIDSLIDSISLVMNYPYLRGLPLNVKIERAIDHLNNEPCLIVLDNFDPNRDQIIQNFASMVKPARSKILMTSRFRYSSEAWSIDLSGLDDDAREGLLLEEGRRLGISTILNSDQFLVTEYLDATGGNPLAIRLTTSQIKYGVSDLRSTTSSLRSATENALFETIFDRIWNDRLAVDRQLHAIVLSIALHKGNAPQEAIKSVLGLHDAELRNAMRNTMETSLVDMHITSPTELARMQLHPLTRAYAQRELDRSPDLRTELERKLIDYYLSVARTKADIHAHPSYLPIIDAERGNIVTFAELAHERANTSGESLHYRQVIDFAEAMMGFLWSRGLWQDSLRMCANAVIAATALGDTVTLARLFAFIGRIHVSIGDYSSALDFLRQSEDTLSGDLPDEDRSETLRLRGHIALSTGDYSEAEALFTRILETAPPAIYTEGHSATLIELGTCALRRGRFDTARQWFEEARELDASSGAIEGLSVSMSHLGETFYESGDNRNARPLFEQGLAYARQSGRLSSEGTCLIGLAKIDVIEERSVDAPARVEAAKHIFDRLGMAEMKAEVRLIVDNISDSTQGSSQGNDSISGILRNCHAVIFDFDDTIAATSRSRWPILRRTAATFGEVLTEETIRQYWGRPFRDLIELIVPKLDTDEFIDSYGRSMSAEHPIPALGAKLLVTALAKRNVRQIIVGSGNRDLTIQDLDQMGLTEFFEDIYCSEQSTVHKPDPAVLLAPLRALERKGVERDKIVYIGDSAERDFPVARGNNLNFIGVLTGSETFEDFVEAGLPPGLIAPNLSLLRMWL